MRGVRERPIVFECRDDTLVGILHSPAEPGHGIGLLVVVGGPQYRVGSHRQFMLMARELAAAGFGVFRFDYRGMGDSGGDMRGFEDVGQDIAAALEVFLREQPHLRGVVLWGLCDGASACLLNSGDPRVRGLILVNPWVRTERREARARIRHYYLRRPWQRSFWKSVFSGNYHPGRSARGLFASIVKTRSGSQWGSVPGGPSFIERMRSGLSSFAHPVLFLISERDLTAREFLDLCSESSAWHTLVRRPSARFVHIANADHTFSTRGALDRAVEECRRFLTDRAD